MFGFVLLIVELSTEINGWDKFNYAKTFDCGLHTVNDNVDRVDSRFVSVEEFREKYEKTYTPCVIVNDQLDWPARKKWSVNVSNYDVNVSYVDLVLHAFNVTKILYW